jgi:hypothetical protein
MWKETETASVDGWMVSVNKGERVLTLVNGEGMVGCLIHHIVTVAYIDPAVRPNQPSSHASISLALTPRSA